MKRPVLLTIIGLLLLTGISHAQEDTLALDTPVIVELTEAAPEATFTYAGTAGEVLIAQVTYESDMPSYVEFNLFNSAGERIGNSPDYSTEEAWYLPADDTYTLTIARAYADDEYELTLSHPTAIMMGDTIEITAEQAQTYYFTYWGKSAFGVRYSSVRTVFSYYVGQVTLENIDEDGRRVNGLLDGSFLQGGTLEKVQFNEPLIGDEDTMYLISVTVTDNGYPEPEPTTFTVGVYENLLLQ